jgi:hypothetical protein
LEYAEDDDDFLGAGVVFVEGGAAAVAVAVAG